jgi:hypothetical protein
MRSVACQSVSIAMMAFCTIIGCSHLQNTQQRFHRISARAEADVSRARTKNASGLKHLHKNDLNKAELDFQEAITADRNYGAAHNNLGKVYLLQHRYYLAAGEFDQAIELMPNRFEPLLNLGQVYEDVERFSDAESYYQIAYEMAPHQPMVIGHCARVRVRQDQYDAQTRSLLEELIFHDNRPEWAQWARELLATKRFDGAYHGDGGRQASPMDLQLIPSGEPMHPPSIEIVPPEYQQVPESESLPFPENGGVLFPVKPPSLTISETSFNAPKTMPRSSVQFVGPVTSKPRDSKFSAVTDLSNGSREATLPAAYADGGVLR